MIVKRDVIWSLVAIVSLVALTIAAWQFFVTEDAAWTSVLATMAVAFLAGGIPYLPEKAFGKYRIFWLMIGLLAWGVLIFWRGERLLRIMGVSAAWLVASMGYFAGKWRGRKRTTIEGGYNGIGNNDGMLPDNTTGSNIRTPS